MNSSAAALFALCIIVQVDHDTFIYCYIFLHLVTPDDYTKETGLSRYLCPSIVFVIVST